jgi:uncharacterized protein
MKKRTSVLIAAIAMCAVLVTVFSLNAPSTSAETSTFERQVSVTGEAELKMEPNLAILSVAVETENKSAQLAASKNATAMNKVMEALKKAGIDADTISTEGYSLYTMSHWEDNKRITDGYRVTNNIRFETPDIDKVGELFDVAIKAGATRVNSPQFTIADQDQIKMQLLEIAMKNATEKADVLVKAAGATRGVVVTISENSIGGNWYRTVNYEMDMAKSVMNDSVTPIEAGDVTLTARVSVSFAIQ